MQILWNLSDKYLIDKRDQAFEKTKFTPETIWEKCLRYLLASLRVGSHTSCYFEKEYQ
jgi:hypothetical protein